MRWESAFSETYDEGVFILGKVGVKSSNMSIHLWRPSSQSRVFSPRCKMNVLLRRVSLLVQPCPRLLGQRNELLWR